MKKLAYIPCQEVCASLIRVEVEDGIVKHASIKDGCMGNTKAVTQLVCGMKGSDVISRLEGICCDGKTSSCPDQLAQAIRKAMHEEEQARAKN